VSSRRQQVQHVLPADDVQVGELVGEAVDGPDCLALRPDGDDATGFGGREVRHDGNGYGGAPVGGGPDEVARALRAS
jgi:hypothetical protein